MDSALISPERLYFVKCLKTVSIIVLTDDESKDESKDGWEDGLLYRNRQKFLSDDQVATHVVAVSLSKK